MSTSSSNEDYWRELKRNTEMKHNLLHQYLLKWASILTGRPSPVHYNLHYIDGFAGRGRHGGGEPGSPIRVMDAGQEIHDFRGGQVTLHCYNIEQDPNNFQSLQSEVAQVENQYPAVSTVNYCGAFQDHCDEILSAIPADEDTFIFIDPFGYKGVEMHEVMKLLRRRKCEIFVTFMSSYIRRYLTDPNRADAMDAIFGTESWQQLADSPQKALVELYGRQIQERGKSSTNQDLYILPINVEFDDRDADVYHLIHVSQHPKGRQAMEDTVNKVKLLSMQESLFSIAPEVEETIAGILERSPSRLTALQLAGKVWLEQWDATWRRDYKEAINNMEARGEIAVTAHDGRNRRHGIKDKDFVSLNRR